MLFRSHAVEARKSEKQGIFIVASGVGLDKNVSQHARNREKGNGRSRLKKGFLKRRNDALKLTTVRRNYRMPPRPRPHVSRYHVRSAFIWHLAGRPLDETLLGRVE